VDVQAILDALSKPYGRHGENGWFYLASVVIAVAGIFGARELLGRRSRFRKKSLRSLNEGKVLKASLQRDSGKGTERLEGELRWSGSRYLLRLLRNGEAMGSPELAFVSWDEVARYLEANSVLRIADFK
jgi:hypothetical protein